MKFYNLEDYNEQVSFSQAVKQGMGTKQGLFFPLELPEFSPSNIYDMLEMDFFSCSSKILSTYIGNEIPSYHISEIVKKSFSFPISFVEISDNIGCFELFHGPTLAFKDFGGRFMANILSYILKPNEKITILTATSGDTGAAVAHAFYNMNNIRVVILYPRGKISPLQEKLFCTLGGNIETISIDGSFDSCQALVKEAFNDKKLKNIINLNSANSINISRLLAQICYYFQAIKYIPKEKRNKVVLSVPSGNFGNLTAGLLAKTLGLPVKRFIAATNLNDTVSRFLINKKWQPKTTITTLSNAMDISQPNNWPRIEELFRRKLWCLNDLTCDSVSDENTKFSIRQLAEIGYISEPHAAIAYSLLRDKLQKGEYGLFLGTAHPAKFKENVEKILGYPLFIPKELANRIKLPLMSNYLKADFPKLRDFLLNRI
ncbi:threonine synthase [Pantoea sp. Aalb]|uniref:threonine synthase n=1 Tax=Pantoea sp. Aalb TaxID=2576762 RepID=UPI001329E58C|nr:threonine synthase [Pantoea sp. Aalb]MXP67153.1 threonine synthase [Pantoea sp. Aalb]